MKRQKRWACSNSNLSEDGNECKVDANSAGREYRTICHNTYAYRVRSGKQYTFTRSKDVTYDTGRSGINNIRVYYDEKNPRKIKFDGNGDRNQHQVQIGCGYTALATFCTMFLVARLLAHLFS